MENHSKLLLQVTFLQWSHNHEMVYVNDLMQTTVCCNNSRWCIYRSWKKRKWGYRRVCHRRTWTDPIFLGVFYLLRISGFLIKGGGWVWNDHTMLDVFCCKWMLILIMNSVKHKARHEDGKIEKACMEHSSGGFFCTVLEKQDGCSTDC